MKRIRRISLPFSFPPKLKVSQEASSEEALSSKKNQRANVDPSPSPLKASVRTTRTAKHVSLQEVSSRTTRDALSDSEVMSASSSITKRRRRLLKKRPISAKPSPKPPLSEILDEDKRIPPKELASQSPGAATAQGPSTLINDLQEPSSDENFLDTAHPDPLESASIISPSPSSPAPLSIILEQDERSVRARTPSLTLHTAPNSLILQTYPDKSSSIQRERNRSSFDMERLSHISEPSRLPITPENAVISVNGSVPSSAPNQQGISSPPSRVIILQGRLSENSTLPSAIVQPDVPSSLSPQPTLPPSLIATDLAPSLESPPSPTETMGTDAYDTAVSTFGEEEEGQGSDGNSVTTSHGGSHDRHLQRVVTELPDSDVDSDDNSTQWSTPTPTLRTVDDFLGSQASQEEIGIQANEVKDDDALDQTFEGGDEIFLVPVEDMWAAYNAECRAKALLATKAEYNIISEPDVVMPGAYPLANDASESVAKHDNIQEKHSPLPHTPVYPPGLSVSDIVTVHSKPDDGQNVPPPQFLSAAGADPRAIPDHALLSNNLEVSMADEKLPNTSKVDKEIQTDTTFQIDASSEPGISHNTGTLVAMGQSQSSYDETKVVMLHRRFPSESSDPQSNTEMDTHSDSVLLMSVDQPSTIATTSNEDAESQVKISETAGDDELDASSTGALVLTPVEVLWRSGLPPKGLPPGAAAPTNVEPVTTSIIDALRTAMASSPAAKNPSTLIVSSSSVSGRSTPGGLPEIRESEEEREDDERSIKAVVAEMPQQDTSSIPPRTSSEPPKSEGGNSVNGDASNEFSKPQRRLSPSALTPSPSSQSDDLQNASQFPFPSSNQDSTNTLTIQPPASSPVRSHTPASPRSTSPFSMGTTSTLPSTARSATSTTPLNGTARAQTSSLSRSFSSFTRSISMTMRSRSLNVLRKREPTFNMITPEESLGLSEHGWGIEPWNGRNSGIGTLALMRTLDHSMRTRSLESPVERTAANSRVTVTNGEVSSGISPTSSSATAQRNNELPSVSPPTNQLNNDVVPKNYDPSSVSQTARLKKLSKRRKSFSKRENVPTT